MKFFMVIPIFCALEISAIYNGTKFYDCGSEYSLERLYIDGCTSDTDHCALNVGNSISVTVIMRAEFPSSEMEQKIYLIIKGIRTEIFSSPGPCQECPIALNTNLTFNTFLEIPKNLPPLPAVLQWTITNEDEVKVLCFSTNVHLCKLG